MNFVTVPPDILDLFFVENERSFRLVFPREKDEHIRWSRRFFELEDFF